MADETAPPAPAGEPVTETTPPARVSLRQFCTELSVTDRRVEMIGGFHHVEKVAGHMLDTPEAYAERYAAFTTAPSK